MTTGFRRAYFVLIGITVVVCAIVGQFLDCYLAQVSVLEGPLPPVSAWMVKSLTPGGNTTLITKALIIPWILLVGVTLWKEKSIPESTALLWFLILATTTMGVSVVALGGIVMPFLPMRSIYSTEVPLGGIALVIDRIFWFVIICLSGFLIWRELGSGFCKKLRCVFADTHKNSDASHGS